MMMMNVGAMTGIQQILAFDKHLTISIYYVLTFDKHFTLTLGGERWRHDKHLTASTMFFNHLTASQLFQHPIDFRQLQVCLTSCMTSL